MNIIDKAVMNSYHDMRVKEFGKGTVEALGWLDKTSQSVRFSMLADIGDMNNRSVLDVGCGHGDLRGYLGAQYPSLHYTGIDQARSFLAVAAERYQLPNTTFLMCDFFNAELPPADYVLLSGSLNYRSSDPDFIYKMIAKLFNASQIACGFNLLSYINDPGGILVAYNIDKIMSHCRTLSTNVVLHNKYCDGDFTVWMYRD
jgi:SAM-dependent methyltransferase